MPATSQLDWLSSTTAMIVLFWSRATRDLLRSFGWGIAALHRLHPATKLPSLRRPPHSISRSRRRPPASLAGFGSRSRPTLSRYREVRQRRHQGVLRPWSCHPGPRVPSRLPPLVSRCKPYFLAVAPRTVPPSRPRPG